jgi:hypothetical protein
VLTCGLYLLSPKSYDFQGPQSMCGKHAAVMHWPAGVAKSTGHQYCAAGGAQVSSDFSVTYPILQ